MSSDWKNIWDVVFNFVTIIGAVTVFVVGLMQWRKSQHWQRAAKLDEFIEKFEKWPLLRLGACILDWSSRRLKLEETFVTIDNDEALLALRDHKLITTRPMFTDQQAYYRDAYDAMLDFFLRLEIGLTTGLIDATPASAYFGYWVERLLKFDRHEDKRTVLGGLSPRSAMLAYIRAYGDVTSIVKLCRHFGIEPPPELLTP